MADFRLTQWDQVRGDNVYTYSGALDRNGNPTGSGTWTLNATKTNMLKAGRAAQGYQGAADTAASGSVAAAQQGANLAREGIAAVTNGEWVNNLRNTTTAMNRSYDQAMSTAASVRNSAANVRTDAAGVRVDAANVRSAADALTPYANQLDDYSRRMWGEGLTLFNQGQDVIGQGNALLKLDASGGGLVGEYVDWIRSIDPDRYVAMAAADTQAAHENAYGQMIRNMTRAGADASSTKSVAYQRKVMQTLTAALAGARTRARMQGLEDQGKALSAALGEAQKMLGTGATLSQTGVTAQGGAVTAEKGAADVRTSQGNLFAEAGGLTAKAGSLEAEAGNLVAKSGSIEVEAGKLMASVGSLGADMAKALVSAYGNAANAQTALANAQLNAARYYGETAAGYGELAGSALFI